MQLKFSILDPNDVKPIMELKDHILPLKDEPSRMMEDLAVVFFYVVYKAIDGKEGFGSPIWFNGFLVIVGTLEGRKSFSPKKLRRGLFYRPWLKPRQEGFPKVLRMIIICWGSFYLGS